MRQAAVLAVQGSPVVVVIAPLASARCGVQGCTPSAPWARAQ